LKGVGGDGFPSDGGGTASGGGIVGGDPAPDSTAAGSKTGRLVVKQLVLGSVGPIRK